MKKSNLKTIILTEGGVKAGLGQITRCASIYRALEERGFEPELLINGDDSVTPIVEGQNFKLFNWQERQDEVVAMLAMTDIAVIDSYRADRSFYQKASDLVKVPIFFDDTRRIEYPRGYVINGAFNAESLDYPRKKGVRHLLGIRYFPLRRECWDLPPRTVAPRVTTVLITFGGSDEKRMTPKVLEFLGDGRPGLAKIVVFGKGFSHRDEIRRVADGKTQLLTDPDGPSWRRAMIACDIAISAAGQTLYELLRSGLPTIAVQVIDNQADNVRGLTRAGAIGFAGLVEDSLTLQNIAAFLAAWDAPEDRQALADRGQALIDGRGCRRIVDQILRDL
jgi:spore coat polysaccharide biosynthesis predicted glycosyltransferase SpsG